MTDMTILQYLASVAVTATIVSLVYAYCTSDNFAAALRRQTQIATSITVGLGIMLTGFVVTLGALFMACLGSQQLVRRDARNHVAAYFYVARH
jgi:hypothetical protein